MTPNDLDPLSPELQALLDAERPVGAAPAGAKARLLAKLSTELFDAPGGGDGGDGGGDGGGAPTGGGAGPSSAPHGAASGASGATAGSAGASGATAAAGSGWVAKAVVTKLVVGASVASMAVGGAIGAGVHRAVVKAGDSEPRTPAPSLPPQTARVEPLPSTPAAPEPSVVQPPPVVPAPVSPKEPRVTADEQLALEKSFVEQARVAMARQDPNAALEALAQHARRFPRGQLTEERMALEVMALSSAGRTVEARNVANSFRKRFPDGLFRATVDAIAPE